jgi:hypothetical protein
VCLDAKPIPGADIREQAVVNVQEEKGEWRVLAARAKQPPYPFESNKDALPEAVGDDERFMVCLFTEMNSADLQQFPSARLTPVAVGVGFSQFTEKV